MPDTVPEPFRLPAPRRGEDEFAADLDARIGSHIKTAEQALMAAKSDALRAFDLTVAQYAALVALYYVPGQSSAQLARNAAVTPQTMAQVLGKLEQKQLIERVPSKLHNKVLVTTLTPAGEELALRADVETRSIEQRLANTYTEHERHLLRDLLDRATHTLRDNE
ncbi:MarR family winged helix-turn-helix transcriptional regulator [Micropruina sp.]|uniref:MarR family winged helix-turn-helix transcriptional regulator n=1 Tax=Micropruina sp. TaxID=2737536 RepID=UPI0039E67871